MVLFTSGLDGRSLQLFIDTVCKDFIEVLVMSRSEYRRHSPPVRDLFGNSSSFESDDSMAGFSFLQWKQHEIKFNARYHIVYIHFTVYIIEEMHPFLTVIFVACWTILNVNTGKSSFYI